MDEQSKPITNILYPKFAQTDSSRDDSEHVISDIGKIKEQHGISFVLILIYDKDGNPHYSFGGELSSLGQVVGDLELLKVQLIDSWNQDDS